MTDWLTTKYYLLVWKCFFCFVLFSKCKKTLVTFFYCSKVKFKEKKETRKYDYIIDNKKHHPNDMANTTQMCLSCEKRKKNWKMKILVARLVYFYIHHHHHHPNIVITFDLVMMMWWWLWLLFSSLLPIFDSIWCDNDDQRDAYAHTHTYTIKR